MDDAQRCRQPKTGLQTVGSYQQHVPRDPTVTCTEWIALSSSSVFLRANCLFLLRSPEWIKWFFTCNVVCLFHSRTTTLHVCNMALITMPSGRHQMQEESNETGMRSRLLSVDGRDLLRTSEERVSAISAISAPCTGHGGTPYKAPSQEQVHLSDFMKAAEGITKPELHKLLEPAAM